MMRKLLVSQAIARRRPSPPLPLPPQPTPIALLPSPLPPSPTPLKGVSFTRGKEGRQAGRTRKEDGPR